MKIECQNCGAAYKIADEKVHGRMAFKIRCRKCSSDVVFRGDEALWHAVLDGEQQGPFGVAQVRDMLAAGSIDASTYVWRDGYEAWLPLREVGELASVFGAGPSPEPVSGQHNESSALFSLATLQQLSGPRGAPASSFGAVDDSSGLIDIHKLAGALGATSGAMAKSPIDEVLAVGASGGLGSLFAAPVLAPVAVPAAAIAAPLAPPRSAGGSSNVTAAIVAAAIIVSLGGLGAMALYLRRGEPVASVVAANVDTRTPASPERAPTRIVRPESTPMPALVPAAVPDPAPAPEAAGDRARDRSHERHHAPSSAAHTPTPTTAPSPSLIAPTPSSAATHRPTTPRGTIEEVMDHVVAATAARPTATAPPAPVASSGVRDIPTRAEVAAAMRGVSPAVRACGTGQGGLATVTFVFNSEGSINTANVAPPSAGTAVGSCVARAVRGAHLSPFARPTFSVTFPFPLN